MVSFFFKPFGKTNFIFVLNYGLLSIHVVQQFQAGATFLKRVSKVELFLCLVQNLIGRVEAAALKYDCNMAKQSAVIYL